MEDKKTTSITLPLEYWETAKELAALRGIQNDAENQSLNSVMVEMMERGVEDARLELAERRRRRKKA